MFGVIVGIGALSLVVGAVGWLLGGMLVRVAVRRFRMCCSMLVVGGGFHSGVGLWGREGLGGGVSVGSVAQSDGGEVHLEGGL